jgi:hypothetical protein
MTAVHNTTESVSEAAAKFVVAKVSKTVDSLMWLSGVLQARDPATAPVVAGLAEQMAGMTIDALKCWPA